MFVCVVYAHWFPVFGNDGRQTHPEGYVGLYQKTPSVLSRLFPDSAVAAAPFCVGCYIHGQPDNGLLSVFFGAGIIAQNPRMAGN